MWRRLNRYVKNSRGGVDLKELEKYGFQKGYKFWCINDEPRIISAVVDKERTLTMQYSDTAWWDNDYWYLYAYNQDKVYDLIKDGLVEKVEE